jgi:hypothetical protein
MGVKLNVGGTLPSKAPEVPGPGAYDPKYQVMVPELPKFSIKGRYAQRKQDQIPAPGTYQVSFADKQKAPAFGFGSSPQRVPLSGKASEVPGPGNYKIPTQIATKNTYIQSQLDEKY